MSKVGAAEKGVSAARARYIVARCATAACMAMAVLVCQAPPAFAGFGIAGFDGQTTADASGTPFTQAGGHPYAISTVIRFNTISKSVGGFGDIPWPDEPVKDLLVDVPPGLVGNPTAIAQCTIDELAFDPFEGTAAGPLCPSASQVGVATVDLTFGMSFTVPVYNMVPPATAPARFGFNVFGVVQQLDAELRGGTDYGLSVVARNLSEGTAILGTRLTLWGVPADDAHTAERSCPGLIVATQGGPSCATDAHRTAFLRLPTLCSAAGMAGLETRLRASSWFHPTQFVSAAFRSHVPPGLPEGLPVDQWGHQQGITGCDDVPFDPTVTARPVAPSSPGVSGFSFDLTLPQTDDPDLIAESDVRRVEVTLPAGVRVSPSAASGLAACSRAQMAIRSSASPTCPDASKIGTVTIETPAVKEPLQGSVYLATPHDNPEGVLIALYLVARGPGLTIKLSGAVAPDPGTDQLTAVFENQPQLPFNHLHLEFKGGPRAALANPPRCGSYTTRAVLTGWNGKTVTSDSSFTTSHDGHGAPCPPAKFRPEFSAGTTNPVAGAFSPLSVTISRSDDDEEIGGVDAIRLPDGLLPKIAGVKLCSGVNARVGRCGAVSQIGTVTTAAGSGPSPFAVDGKVYLGGRYKGAPFSVVFQVPVIAGPFDLGQVTIRGSADIDRHNATIKVKTDPLPTILEGIPLQVRLINVMIDRKDFFRNPTSCAEKQITGSIRSTAGKVAHVRNRFQVGECASLGLRPDFSIRVGSRGHTRKGSSVPLKTVLKMPGGGANLKSVGVSLPLSLTALLDVVSNACTQAEFDAKHCENARAGSATAITPLLDHGLRGGVYFVTDPDEAAGALPNLVVALRGQVPFDLVGKIRIPNGQTLATDFTKVPDVPIKKFVLSLVAGSHSPLAAAENLCSKNARRKTASLVFKAQNGRVVRERQHLRVAGCGHRRSR